MKKPVKIALLLFALLLISVFVFSAYKLYDILHGYKEAERSYDSLSTEYVSGTGEENSGEDTTGPEDPLENAERSPINVDFPALMQSYKDIIGWIYCPDTVINYPVVMGEDNSYYLNRLADGTRNANGSIFADFRSGKDFSSRNTVLYGHHMNDGSMFASLVNYKNQSYMDAHPSLYLNTPSQNYRVDVFSAFVTQSTSAAYNLEFADDYTFLDFCEKMKNFSDSKTNVTVSPGDRIVCLSTCTYEYTDARYVVFGKLVPIR